MREWESTPRAGTARCTFRRRRPSSATSGIFWAAHQADLPYAQIERLVNLDELLRTGFEVACFPRRIAGASAAPARVVALLSR